MRPLQAIVIRLKWVDVPLVIPMLVLALVFIPTAFLLVYSFEKLGWLAFTDIGEEEW